MARPFETHIPFFPGEIKPELPTAETTVFNNSVVVTSLELIAGYVDPKATSKNRSENLRNIGKFCFEEENYHIFTGILSQLQDSPSQDENTSLPQRIVKMQTLSEKLDDQYLNSDSIFSRDQSPALPVETEVDRNELSRIISLANDAMESAFPNQYGVQIPRLLIEDITVATDRDVLRFQKDDAGFSTHPFHKHVYDRYAQQIGAPSVPALSKKESEPMLQVVSTKEGMPVVLPLSALEADHDSLTTDQKRAVVDFNLVRGLIHENFHRSVKPTAHVSVTSDDSLWSLAWGPDEGLLQHMSQSLDPNYAPFKQYVRSLQEYALSHNPTISFIGARVQLFCEDDKGIARIMTESGHDLNEALVEVLTYKAYDHFLKTSRKDYDPVIYTKLSNFIKEMARSDSTYRYGNLFNEIGPLLRTLKLKDAEELLQQYSSQQIPSLYSKYLANESYLF